MYAALWERGNSSHATSDPADVLFPADLTAAMSEHRQLTKANGGDQNSMLLLWVLLDPADAEHYKPGSGWNPENPDRMIVFGPRGGTTVILPEEWHDPFGN